MMQAIYLQSMEYLLKDKVNEEHVGVMMMKAIVVFCHFERPTALENQR